MKSHIRILLILSHHRYDSQYTWSHLHTNSRVWNSQRQERVQVYWELELAHLADRQKNTARHILHICVVHQLSFAKNLTLL